MSQGKRVDMTTPIGSVENAVLERDWETARYLMAVRLGRMMDATESARDAKAVAMSLAPMVDKLEAEDKSRRDETDTRHAEITRRADEARRKALGGGE